MTLEPTIYRLAGWIRLVPGDCLGIAVFTDGTNTEFIAETDDRLHISEFLAFYNVEGYKIERRLSPGARVPTYSVGSGVPIPFSRGDLTIVAHADEGATAFLAAQESDGQDPTVKAVAEIIERGETGVFEQAGHSRAALGFETRYSTVFQEGPVHSRYWTEQLKSATLEVPSLTVGARQSVLAKLKLITGEWWRRFRLTGEPTMIMAFIQTAKSLKLLTCNEAKRACHALALRLMSANDQKTLLDPDLNAQIKQLIPKGLYYYEIGPEYSKAQKPYGDEGTEADLLVTMHQIIRAGESNYDFRWALEASNLMFGTEALPPDIHGKVSAVAGDLARRINYDTRQLPPGRVPAERKKGLLFMHQALVTLRQMLDWQERSESAKVALGLSDEATFFLSEWTKQGL